MLKRVLIGGSIALIAIVFLFFFLIRKGTSFKEALATEAVPSSAVMFIENIDYQYFTKDFSEESLLWKAVLNQSRFHEFDSVFRLLDARISTMTALRKRILDEGFSISLHVVGKNKLSALFYVSLGDNISIGDIQAEIQEVLGADALVNTRKYEAVELNDISFKHSDHLKGFAYVVKDGLLIASTAPILIEDAIRSLNSGGGIQQQAGFRKVAATAGKYVYGNVFVNFPLLDQLFYPLVNSNMLGKLSGISDLAGWGEFDIDIREDEVLFNGMTTVEDTIPGWLNLFKGQSPVRMEATSFVPSNAYEFLSLGISDVKKFREQFRKELQVRDEYQGFLKSEKEIEKRIAASAFNLILDLIDDEVAWFTIEDKDEASYQEVAMLEIRSRSEASELLTGWVSLFASEKGESLEDYTSKFVLDDQTSFSIYTFPSRLYSSGIMSKFVKSNFAIYDNYLIFSDSKDAISRTIYQNVLHKTLENESSYEAISNLMSTRANMTYLIRPEFYLKRQANLLADPVKGILEEMSGTIKKIPGLIIQFANEGDIIYSNVSIKYTSNLREKAMTVWESLLDSITISKPYLVTNHYSSDKEILVQDATNTLSLVNSTGRVLWEVRLEGPILSEIVQVDYYKNGKLQYIFNTRGKIHLIDRNGNYVERYPVKLRSDATNGMVLFDYDKRNDYRLFVACEDRRVYAYDLEGKIVTGWSFRKSEGMVSKAIQHFRIREKDYIIFSDNIRTYILDRRGEERIKLKVPVVISRNNLFYLDMNISGDGPRFVSTDTTGNVIGVDLTGKAEVLLAHSATKGHFFRIKDLDRDGKPEYIFASENELEVLDFKGKRLFSFKLKSDISTLPDIYEFSSTDLKIGLTDVEKNQIYLLNADGSLYEGFPLEGNTRFSIGYFAGSDSRFNLIVGSQNGFLYNYSIE